MCPPLNRMNHILVECIKHNQQRIENQIPNQIEDVLDKQCQIDNLFKYLLHKITRPVVVEEA